VILRSPRFTVRQMMIAVAMAAIGCAAVPFLVVDPVSTLIVAALASAIAVVATRGRNKAALNAALALGGIATLAAAAQESRTLWQDSTYYRRMANRHADRRDRILDNIPYFDRQHRTVGGPALEQYQDRRRQWVSYSDYDSRMIAAYDRAARRPWLRVAPEPEPPRSPGLDPLLILQNLR
jgi:hypothetical protein